MANRFWVGGTTTWDTTTTANWSTTSGGSSGASVPGSADVAIFDGGSGAAVITASSSLNGITLAGITLTGTGNFIGTLDLSGSTGFTIAGTFSISGSGVRVVTLGSGTFHCKGSNSNCWDATTTTGLTFSGASSTIIIDNGSANTSSTFVGGGLAYGTITVSARTVNQAVNFTGANTIGTLNLAGPLRISIAASTITNIGTITGSSTALIYWGPSSSTAIPVTLTLTNSGLASWVAFANSTFATGTLTATNSFDLGGNSGTLSISGPTVGGGGIIGA